MSFTGVAFADAHLNFKQVDLARNSIYPRLRNSHDICRKQAQSLLDFQIRESFSLRAATTSGWGNRTQELRFDELESFLVDWVVSE